MTEQQDSPQKPNFWLFSSESSALILIFTCLLIFFMAGMAVGSQFSWAVIGLYFYPYLLSIAIVLGIYAAAFYAYLMYKRGI